MFRPSPDNILEALSIRLAPTSDLIARDTKVILSTGIQPMHGCLLLNEILEKLAVGSSFLCLESSYKLS
jgi:hypothetical protein